MHAPRIGLPYSPVACEPSAKYGRLAVMAKQPQSNALRSVKSGSLQRQTAQTASFVSKDALAVESLHVGISMDCKSNRINCTICSFNKRCK